MIFRRDWWWRRPEWWTVVLSGAAWATLLAGAPHPHEPDRVRQAGQWGLMIVAMMVPLAKSPIRFVAARSYWTRRHRAVGAFLAGFLLLWMSAGGAFWMVGRLLVPAVGSRVPLIAATLVTAVLWQLAPAHRRALKACLRTSPLAPDGWAADRDCLMYGFRAGARCLGTCWALMLVCLTIPGVLPMAGATAVAVFERR